MAKLLAVKPLSRLLKEAENEGESGLKRTLGPLNLITLGIGAIIGAGIFVLTGQAAAIHAGPAVVLSFVLAGITCAFAGLCYAEFASLIPIAGSAYTYGYATLGEFVAWIIGWDLVLEYAFGAATVASGWSGYFVGLFADLGITIPPQFTTTPGTVLYLFHGRWQQLAALPMSVDVDPAQLPHVTGVFNLVAFLAITVVTAVLIIGIQESANLNTAIVIVKLGVVGVFLVLGIGYILKHPAEAHANWTPFIPPSEGPGRFGLNGITAGAASIFFAYIGFDAVSTAAQEAKNPKRDMPIGILGIAGGVHGVVHPGFGNADWAGELPGVECGRSGCGWHRCDGRSLGLDSGEGWRGVRAGYCDAGDVAGPVASVLFDVAGWIALEVGGEDSSEVPDALDIEHGGWSDCGVHAGAVADRQVERAGKYGNAAGVHDRVRWSVDSATT